MEPTKDKHSEHYIPTKEVPPEETAQALRDKFREKNKECESLRAELAKQKELKDELVKFVKEILDDHRNLCFMMNFEERCESLIKKTNEI